MRRELSDRVTQLEIQLSHIERLYEQLDEVVTAQAMETDRMQRQIEQLRQQLKELKEGKETDTDPLDEKPPHY